ncbi:hypothetical protein CBL_10354 [Carabus blaptoides fortunei]
MLCNPNSFPLILHYQSSVPPYYVARIFKHEDLCQLSVTAVSSELGFSVHPTTVQLKIGLTALHVRRSDRPSFRGGELALQSFCAFVSLKHRPSTISTLDAYIYGTCVTDFHSQSCSDCWAIEPSTYRTHQQLSTVNAIENVQASGNYMCLGNAFAVDIVMAATHYNVPVEQSDNSDGPAGGVQGLCLSGTHSGNGRLAATDTWAVPPSPPLYC